MLVLPLLLATGALARSPCEKFFWRGQCTACPGYWYQSCGAGNFDAGEKGCGFLGCETRCRDPDGNGYDDGCGCNKGVACLNVNCEVSAFGAWGECSKPCGGGVQERVRTVTKEQKGNGKACPDLKETKDCAPWVNTDTCLKPSEAGDACKTLEWYTELCANQFGAGDCKKAGCAFKKEKCVPVKLGKKIKCKKLKTKVEGEDICECFSGCNLKEREKKNGKKKEICLGTHVFPKPDKEN